MREGLVSKLIGSHGLPGACYLVVPPRGYLSPRILPTRGNSRISTMEQAYDFAAMPGFKRLIVPDTKSGNFLAAGLQVRAFNEVARLGRQATLGAATGGSWEAGRYVLGMPDFCREMYGMSLPANGTIPAIGPLDDYYQSEISYEYYTGLLGPEQLFIENGRLPWRYVGEHKIWAGKLGIEVIGPPIIDSPIEAAVLFNKRLNTSVRNVLVQAFGVGISWHPAFDEPGTNLFNAPTRFTLITDLTKLANSFAFMKLAEVKRDEANPVRTSAKMMFRDIGAAFRLLTINQIHEKARQLAARDHKPRELDYVRDEVWQRFVKDFDQLWDEVLEIAGRVPSGAITQGTHDLRKTKGLNLVYIPDPQKRWAALAATEGRISSDCPASFFQTMPSCLVMMTPAAAVKLKRRNDCFIFEPDQATSGKIKNFGSEDLADRFWGRPEKEKV